MTITMQNYQNRHYRNFPFPKIEIYENFRINGGKFEYGRRKIQISATEWSKEDPTSYKLQKKRINKNGDQP